MVGQQDRLRPLEVCVAGQDEVPMRLSNLDYRAHRLEQAVPYASCGVPNEEMEVEGDLVVTTPARVQLERHVPDDFAQTSLDGRVHVLVRKSPRKPPRL